MNRRLVAIGLVGTLAVVACTSEARPATPKPRAPKSSEFVARTENTPGTLANFVGAHADLRNTRCVEAADGWTATGAVRNPSRNTAQYRIYVSFLDGDTTVGVSETDLATVAPRATRRWRTRLAVAGTDLRCVLRVERAKA